MSLSFSDYMCVYLNQGQLHHDTIPEIAIEVENKIAELISKNEIMTNLITSIISVFLDAIKLKKVGGT